MHRVPQAGALWKAEERGIKPERPRPQQPEEIPAVRHLRRKLFRSGLTSIELPVFNLVELLKPMTTEGQTHA